MRNSSGIEFARPVHRAFLYHCDSIRNIRRGSSISLPLGRPLQTAWMVRRRRSDRIFGIPDRRLRVGVQKGRLGVGLIRLFIIPCSLFFVFSFYLAAAPQLRLSQTVVGPVSVATGVNTTAPAVDAANVGDGN